MGYEIGVKRGWDEKLVIPRENLGAAPAAERFSLFVHLNRHPFREG